MFNLRFLICLVITLWLPGAHATQAIEPDKAPVITVRPRFWDFGEVEKGTTEKKIFIVENAGNEDLVIESVYTSCACTTAEISSRQVAPGQKAKLKVSYNTKGMLPGQDSKDIYIDSNDPVNPRTKVIISATIAGPEAGGEKDKPVEIPAITSEELYLKLEKSEEVVILDVREKNEYLRRHIPGAVWFPKSRFDRGDKELLAQLEEIDKGKTVVSYCGAGHRSSYVTRKLREKGYNAYNLDGISFWENKGHPLIRGPELPPGLEPVIIGLEEAYQHYFLLFESVVWVDVRNKKGYDRGHVKGALGIPLSFLEYNLDKISKEKEVVLYCEGIWEGGKCDASMSAGRILIEKGFKQGKIKVFEDGFNAWEDAGYPIERKN